MPYASKAQARMMFAKEKAGEIKKGTAMRWAKKTNFKGLPEKITPSKRKAYRK